MSHNSVEGSVVSQQTVLSFLRHPPSPVGSRQLPQCALEQRGRKRGFAMAQRTQLRFNLAVPPNPANLACRFKPSPSPVVIQRLSLPRPTFAALSSERLALAVRLAKRDLQQGTIPPQLLHTPATVASDSVVLGTARKTQPHSNLSPASQENALVMAQPTASQSSYPPPPTDTLPPPPPPTGTLPPPPTDTRPPPPTSTESGADARDTAVAEIVRLRRELGQQLQRLRELAEQTQACVPASSSGRGRMEKGVGSRVQWDTEKSEEERRQKREREWEARSNRMLYNLRQEVTGLQRELEAPEQKPTPARIRHTKKSQAMQRLAAAHRAAVRTLRHYTASSLHTGTPHRLPSELSLLLQKLSLLCTQLEVGGAKEEVGGATEAQEMEQLLQQIKESSQVATGGVRGTHVSQEPVQRQPWSITKPAPAGQTKSTSWGARTELDSRGGPESARPRATSGERRGHRKVRRARPKAKRPGVLLQPQLRSRGRHKRTHHFTQATYSSRLKQHKAFGKTPVPSVHPSPPHNTLEPPPHTHQHTSTPTHHHHHPSSGRVRFVSSDQWTGRERLPSAAEQTREHHQPSPGNESPPGEIEDGFCPWSVSEPTLVVGGRRQRGEGKMEGTQGGRREVQGRSIRTEPSETAPRRTAAISDAVLDDVSGHTVREGHRLEDPPAAEEGASGVLQQSALAAMLSRVEELQLEEERICQKWTTISYGDPFPQQRPRCAPILKQNELPTPVVDAQPTPLSLPPSLLSSVQHYRDSREHYLRLTGVRTAGSFNPWGLVERLADDLLDELVQEVSSELGQLCDSCVEQLYSQEFARPSDE